MNRDQQPPAGIDNSEDQSYNQDVFSAAKGSGILFFGRAFEQGSRFIFTVIVTRSIGVAGFGLYTIGLSVTLILASVAMLGLPGGMLRFLPAGLHDKNEERVRGILRVGLGLSGIVGLGLAIILFVLADFLAENVFREPEVAPIFRWISLWIPLEAVGQVLMASILGFKRMKYQVYSYSITFSLIKIGLTVLFLVLGFGVTGVVVAHAIAWIVAIGMLVFFLNRLIPLRGPQNLTRQDVRELLSFSVPLSLTEITYQLRGNVDLLLLSVLGTIEAVGVYSAVMRIRSAGDVLLDVISRMSMPIISDLDYQADMVGLGRLYKTLTRWTLTFMTPLVLTAAFFAGPILAIFGDEFVTGAPVLIIISIGLLIGAATRISDSMIVMTGHSRLTLMNTVVALALNALLSFLMIPIWGILGAAAASTLTWAFFGVVRLVQVYWLQRLWPYYLALSKLLLAGAFALLVSYLTNRYLPADDNLVFLALNIAILWVSYLVSVYLLGLAEDDYMVLSRAEKRFRSALSRS